MEGHLNSPSNISQPIKRTGSTAKDVLKSLKHSPSKTSSRFCGNDQNFIQIAQVVADQNILHHRLEEATLSLVAAGSILDPLNDREFSLAALNDALLNILPSASRLDLKALLGLDLQHGAALSKMSPPHISVRRGKDSMEISPPALYFWEELGLAPSQQDKDVTAFVVYPDNDAVSEAASTYLDMLENSYQSCRLGRHTRGNGLETYQGGLVPVQMPENRPDTVFSKYREICEELGESTHTLAEHPLTQFYLRHPNSSPGDEWD